MTLQDKTSDVMVSHAVEVNKYAISEKKRILSELTFVLNEVKKELAVGDKKVTLSDLREMQSKASKIFLEGSRLIKKNMFNDSEELMILEAEEQVKMLQKLIDDYIPLYNYRTPSLAKTKRDIKDATVKGTSILGWMETWETKTNNMLKSGLHSGYTENEDRYAIIEYVFGTSDNPLEADLFRTPTKQLGDLSLSLTDLTMAMVTANIGDYNPSIIIGEQWNSCLCATTCASCASLHGAINYYDGKDETDGNTIPLHPSCMCFWTYVYKEPKDMAVEVPKAQKDNITSNKDLPRFQQWYDSISDNRKKVLFGTSRVTMLENGTVKLNQLVSSSNRRLYTLDELSKKGYRLS